MKHDAFIEREYRGITTPKIQRGFIAATWDEAGESYPFGHTELLRQILKFLGIVGTIHASQDHFVSATDHFEPHLRVLAHHRLHRSQQGLKSFPRVEIAIMHEDKVTGACTEQSSPSLSRFTALIVADLKIRSGRNKGRLTPTARDVSRAPGDVAH